MLLVFKMTHHILCVSCGFFYEEKMFNPIYTDKTLSINGFSDRKIAQLKKIRCQYCQDKFLKKGKN